jgi:sugar/nucleoside kinase (ribokinase family)
VVIKCGLEGALARRADEGAFAAALPFQVVDTSAAGDSFDAGFLYGWLKDWNLAKSLALAAACGSLSTRLTGGTSSQPTLEEAMKYV